MVYTEQYKFGVSHPIGSMKELHEETPIESIAVLVDCGLKVHLICVPLSPHNYAVPAEDGTITSTEIETMYPAHDVKDNWILITKSGSFYRIKV